MTNRTRAGRRRAALLVPLLAAALAAASSAVPAAAGVDVVAPGPTVLVQERVPATDAAERAVIALGGRVTRPLPIADGFAAEVPEAALARLRADASVRAVSSTGSVSFDGAYGQGSGGPSAVYSEVVRANRAWQDGYTGQGIGVAVIDTGVNPVGDLAGRVVHSEDFTAERDGVDRFGHGTFVAGLIAGTGSTGAGVRGVAPDARIISLKIAGRDGSADITQVMAALQWAVSFKDQYGIRVVNLSLGTDSTQDYRIDPLNMAVERAWAAGLVVVVSASNRGPAAGTVSKPADDPWVITVGATADRSTPGIGDDTVPAYSAAGPTRSNGLTKPDLSAPGTSVVSTRAVGSAADLDNPTARVGEQHFVGSGTSFASGVVSGAAALVLSRTPTLDPDQVKARLTSTARIGSVTDPQRVGAGWLDAYAATASDSTARANQGLARSDGSGTLQAARGTQVMSIVTGEMIDPVLGSLPVYTSVEGELTAQNLVFDRLAYAGDWNASSWGASSWGASSWGASSWGASSWGASSWYASSWGGAGWE